MKSAVIPLCAICDTDIGLAPMGKYILQAYEGIRTMIVLASRSKPPLLSQLSSSSSTTTTTASAHADFVAILQPYLQSTHSAVQDIRNLRLDRKYDAHVKAITECMTSISWVLMQSPQQLPSSFVKECLGSTAFWTNRIRKEHKQDAAQVLFCDTIQRVITELTTYIQTYHTTGLAFNPRSHVSIAEAAILLSDEPTTGTTPHGSASSSSAAAGAATSSSLLLSSSSNHSTTGSHANFDGTSGVSGTKSPMNKRHPTLGNVVVGGNVAGIIGELSKRKNADGTSAATGLKHVRSFGGGISMRIYKCIYMYLYVYIDLFFFLFRPSHNFGEFFVRIYIYI
jgi:hypothetical protein